MGTHCTASIQKILSRFSLLLTNKKMMTMMIKKRTTFGLLRTFNCIFRFSCIWRNKIFKEERTFDCTLCYCSIFRNNHFFDDRRWQSGFSCWILPFILEPMLDLQYNKNNNGVTREGKLIKKKKKRSQRTIGENRKRKNLFPFYGRFSSTVFWATAENRLGQTRRYDA